MNLLWSTFGVSLVSGLIPVLSVEVYLGAIGTRTTIAASLALSLVAAAGQTLGKVVWYAAGRWSIETAWVRRRLDRPRVRPVYDRWEQRTQGRPWFAATVLFLAASLGVPPLLVMAVLAGSLHMRFWLFAVSCFAGRALRFYALMTGVVLLTG
jgi:membrane protein YqaA with SNARE-associated domain